MNIDSLIDYVEQNFRTTLYGIDYEILESISKSNYSESQIKEAVNRCKENNTDSIKYLQKVLINMKQNNISIQKPSWMDTNIKAEKCSDEELQELQEMMKEFMED